MSVKVLVIGGGPAGMMAAGTAASLGAEVILLEKNDRLGKKLLITGKGRCNITNACTNQEFIANVTRNGKFLYSAINKFSTADAVEFFEDLGVKTKTERGNRVFPVSDKAADVCEAMRRYVLENGVKTVRASVKRLVISDGGVTGAVTLDGRLFSADSIIIATGGKSYPLTGSTGDGYRLAAQAGHKVSKPVPSLVPLVCDDADCTAMQGLSLKNTAISVIDGKSGNVIYKDFGEMLFTHFGLSGPMILSASAHMRPMENKRYTVVIDLKPALSAEQLDARILRDFEANINRDAANAFSALLPQKMIPTVLKRWGTDAHTKCNAITREQRARLVSLLKNLTFTVKDFRPIDEAIVTSGGADVSQIDPRTMESRITKGLFFAGEVIDVDAYTGGFNLQIAFCTGRTAGESAAFLD